MQQYIKRTLFSTHTNFRFDISRGLKYMIPGLHPLEEQYVRSQTKLILDHQYKSKQEQEQNITALIGEYPNSRFFQDELLVKRMCSLLDLTDVHGEEERRKYFKLLDQEAEGKEVKVFRSDYYQQLAKRLLYLKVNEDKGDYDEEISCILDFRLLVEKTLDRRFTSAKLHENDDLMFKPEIRNKFPVIKNLKTIKRLESRVSTWKKKFDVDEVDSLRNVYILLDCFKNDLEDEALQKALTAHENKRGKKLLSQNPLEILIYLNMYDQLLPIDDAFSEESKDEFVKDGLFTTIYYDYRILPSPVCDFSPLAYHMKLWKNVGFDNLALRQIFNMRYPMTDLLEFVDSELSLRHEDFDESSARLSQNLQTLDSKCLLINGSYTDIERLLLICTEQHLFPDNYTPVLSFIRRNNLMNQRKKTFYNANQVARTLEMQSLNGQKKMETISILKSRGFSDDQIGKELKIIEYPPNEVLKVIRFIDEKTDAGLNWCNESNALSTVLNLLRSATPT